MPDLERRLSELGRDLDYPRASYLAPAVRRRIESREARRSIWPRRLALAAAIALVALAALIAFPPSRDAIAGFFGIRGVIVNRVPTVPSPTPASSSSIGARLDLGRQVTLAQAQAAVDYHVLVPASLGAPDQLYLVDTARRAVALVYLPRPGLPQAAQTGVGALIIEFPGRTDSNFLFKMVGQDATIEEVPVNGQPGFWISGKPHAIAYADASGNFEQDTLRLSGDTLLWTQGALTLRIESGLSKAQALAVAASLH
ncbi:MAG TPA: hypothetical protein VET65_08265 [Candidatus Limnocylindrales bacterium]|nr:hypothetical protein [Candidatus Limnocylindrales bacterium]